MSPKVLDLGYRQLCNLPLAEVALPHLSLAAPIRDRDTRVVAAINISTDTSWGTAQTSRQRMLDPLLQTAAAIQDVIRNISL